MWREPTGCRAHRKCSVNVSHGDVEEEEVNGVTTRLLRTFEGNFCVFLCEVREQLQQCFGN